MPEHSGKKISSSDALFASDFFSRPDGTSSFALAHDHGTEVPCYLHRVPPGRKMAAIQASHSGAATFPDNLEGSPVDVRLTVIATSDTLTGKMSSPIARNRPGGEMRPARDALKLARHFSAGVQENKCATSPVGTAEKSRAAGQGRAIRIQPDVPVNYSKFLRRKMEDIDLSDFRIAAVSLAAARSS